MPMLRVSAVVSTNVQEHLIVEYLIAQLHYDELEQQIQ